MLSVLVHATPSVYLHKQETLGPNLDTSFSFIAWELIAKPCQFHLLNIPEPLCFLPFLSKVLSSISWLDHCRVSYWVPFSLCLPPDQLNGMRWGGSGGSLRSRFGSLSNFLV